MSPSHACSTVGLGADPIVDRVLKTLLTVKKLLGHLDGDVAKRKLDLVQFPSGIAPQAGAGSGEGHAGPGFQWLLFWRSPLRRATPPAPLHRFPSSCLHGKRTQRPGLRLPQRTQARVRSCDSFNFDDSKTRSQRIHRMSGTLLLPKQNATLVSSLIMSNKYGGVGALNHSDWCCNSS
jgi:hypothetical protein